MGTLRTPETEEKYSRFREEGGLNDGCNLCKAPALETFTHWKVINNNFPYDKIASKHEMIIPIAHATLEEVGPEAWMELQEIKNGPISHKFDYLIESTTRKRTIPEHFHLHLVQLKD